MTTALITGIGGQDGHYLAELLNSKGYRVVGLVRDGDRDHPEELAIELPFVETVSGDLTDLTSLIAAVGATQPDEVYNLGALSSVAQSWAEPEVTADVTGLGTLRLLKAIEASGLLGSTRFYQASSSEMFGRATHTPQNEDTPFRPIHPYATAKVFAHQTTVNFREGRGLFAACGILFNHESPRRSARFVARKITRAVARISLGLQDGLVLGDTEIRRDWGYAPEYVDAMWRMLQQSEPQDYVVATGVSHSLREFVEYAFLHAGISDWEHMVSSDASLARPTEIRDQLCGDSRRAKEQLGWTATTDLKGLVGIMVDADLQDAASET